MILRSSSLFGLLLVSIDNPTFGDYIDTDYDANVMDQLIKQRRKSTMNTLGHGVRFQTLAEKYGAEFETSADAALTAIAGLTTTSVTDVSATGDWTDFASAASYSYEVLLASNSEVIASGSVVASTTPITGLTPGTAYILKVRALDASDVVISSWTSSEFTTGLAAPTNLTVGTITATGATGDWDDYPSATGYDYEIRKASDDSLVTSGSVVPSTKAVTGLTTATNYIFKVRATLAVGGPTAFVSTPFTTV